ncbi:hypothetical protein D3C72_2017780 [compost metagenome]
MDCPPVSAIIAFPLRLLCLGKLQGNSVSLQLQALELLLFALHTHLLGTVQTISVFLTRQHRVIMHTESELGDMRHHIADSTQVR